MNIITIASIILIVLGIAPLVMTLIKMKMIRSFKQKAVMIDATVTHAEKRNSTKGGTYYILTLEYKTLDTAQLFTVKKIVFKKQEPGDNIPAMYMHNDPAKFSIDFGERLKYIFVFSIVFFLLIVWFCSWLNNLEYTVQKI